MGTRDEVLARLNADDPVGAALIARGILATNPGNADVLGLLGLALEDVGQKEDAIDALRRAVALPADPSIALRNTTNLAAMLIAGGLKSEAHTLLRAGRRWPPDVAIGDNERQCVTLLADIMMDLDLKQELVEFLLPLSERVPHHWDVVRGAALALSAVGQHGEALTLLEASVRPQSEEPERQAILAYLYLQTGHPDKAGAASAAYSYHATPYVAPRKADQWFTVAVLNPVPAGKALIARERDQHFNGNFPAQLASKLASRYRFTSILLGAGPSAVANFRQQQARVLINNVVNAEVLLDGSSLAAAQTLVEATKLPVINLPQRAALCTRQMNFERFAGAPNVITPRLKRFNLHINRLDELIRLTEQSFAYPLLVRTVRDHEAQNIVLVEDRASLQETLLRLRQHPQIYLIQYVGATRHAGCHRRLRAAFVEGVPVVVRADYDRHWIVQGRKRESRQEFYRRHPDILADANDIVARPHARLGAAAMAALDAIGRAVPLDIFGLDFDVDDSGRVVFFEANPSMNLFSNAPADLDYPPSADALLLERIERMLHGRAEPGVVSTYAGAPRDLGSTTGGARS